MVNTVHPEREAVEGKTSAEQLITENIDVWTSVIKKRGSQGRGSSKKIELYGIKKLRELILELAVRGLLVPQNSNDEPASVLLEKIAAKKEQLIKDEVIKKTKPQSEVTDKEKPHAIPDSWRWVRFGDLAQHNSGKTLDKSRNTGLPRKYLTTSNLYWGKFKLDIIKEMLIREDELDKCTAIKGDLLICEGGDAGRAAVWEHENICFQNHVHRARFYTAISSYYAYRVFEKLSYTGEIENYRKGVGISNMSGKALASVIFPLPPELEQLRIDAKVNELMALCDQLEQQTESSLSAHQTLVETLLNTLLTAAQTTGTKESNSQSNNQESSFDQAWNRIAQHFDILFTTEHSIDQLKQTILQLAVMGKLVPQDPNDEPASVLLEKIAAEKEQLIKDKKIKKQKALPPIGDDEQPFELPQGWAWARIGDLLSLKNGHAFKSKYFCEVKTEYTLTTPGNFYEEGGFRVRGDKTKFYDGPIEPEFVFKPNDLIIPMTEQAPGLLGSAAFIPNDGNVYIHNQRLGKLTPHHVSITKRYLYLFFNAPYLRKCLASTCTGTTVRHTSPDRILSVLIPVMSEAEQVRIDSKVESIVALFDPLKAHIRQSQVTQLHLADTMGDSIFGRTTIINPEEKKEKIAMKISTELSLGSVEFDKTAILAPLIGKKGADAKLVWSKSKLELPEFYKQLKLEITAGFIEKPTKAEFEG